ncbi:MAG: PKD domain-containing protein [Thermoplasmatales archaeon]|nr:PKD domain-containing protein [Thermoplasmatales archaeon]
MKKLTIFIVGMLVFSALAIANNPPEKPTINGPSSGEAGKEYTFTAVANDPDGDKIFYCFDWGDGNEFCTQYVNSGQQVEAKHTWQEKGTYVVTVTATDEHGAKSEPATLQVSMPLSQSIGYSGRLRIYILEPISRWNDYNKNPYNFGFLEFAYDENVNVPYMEKANIEVDWVPSQSNYPDVSEDNIMVIAALFNPSPHKGYAYPPSRNPFNAYYVDACAAARPGEEGSNSKEGTTHTVFIEVATATYCPYCPAMGGALKSIFDKNVYPFYYVSMIGDVNSIAYNRLKNDYNLYGYPTAFFDGGRKVLVGGTSNEATYENAINYCMGQDVHDLNLNLKVDWLTGCECGAILKINVTIENLEMGDVTPPNIIVEKPKKGCLYLFDREILSLPIETAIVFGKITLKANVTDDSGVKNVVFTVCGETLLDDNEPPYECLYDGTFGSHTLIIGAYDVNGNYAEEQIYLYVINI